MTRLLSAALALMLLTVPALAVPLGDDGLHKPDWLRETFKELPEDLAEATSEGKRLLILIEQRGCIYCTRMHEEVFTDPEVAALLRDNYVVIQMNLFGDVEVTDFDGTALPEKDMVARWGAMFTPTLIFLPETVPGGQTASDAAVAMMPGAFGTGTTRALLTWVRDKEYESGEHFQRYLARMMVTD